MYNRNTELERKKLFQSALDWGAGPTLEIGAKTLSSLRS